MVSIIVCSIKPDLLNVLKKNVSESIGCEYEFVDIDNRELKWSIAKVYNEGARRAKFPNLLFVHEDVEFLTEEWGKAITEKLSEPDCGVIGFAGSRFKPSVISGWFAYTASSRENYHAISKGKMRHLRKNGENNFEQVITIDGLAMFVRKEVWEKHPFDEEHLTGFHCYDIDFTMQISLEYKNYICYNINILHKSNGTYDNVWLETTMRMMKAKWNKLTPIGLEKPDRKTEKKMNEDLLWTVLKLSWKHNSPYYNEIVKEYKKLPMSFKHLDRSTRLFFKYRKK